MSAPVALPGEEPVRSGASAPRLSPEHLAALNQALLTAQHRAERAGRIEAELRLAHIEAREAARQFAAVRDQVSGHVGVRLGETHGWDERTGEVRPIQKGTD